MALSPGEWRLAYEVGQFMFTASDVAVLDRDHSIELAHALERDKDNESGGRSSTR